jgi:hypothetical protein
MFFVMNKDQFMTALNNASSEAIDEVELNISTSIVSLFLGGSGTRAR